MSDLISRSALLEEAKSLTVTVMGLRAGKGVLHEYAKQYKNTLLRIINEQPTIEAVPVVERDKIIDEFYDEVLNFEDYIEPITDDNGILLYSGCDITDMIVKIKKKFERSNHEKN